MVSLPQSMVFDILGKFPSQSFKIEERVYKPSTVPTSGRYAKNDTIRINMSSAVNEFVIGVPDIQWEQSAVYKLNDGVTLLDTECSGNIPAWRPGPSALQSVRETVNSGSLVTFENTSRQTFNPFQCMRMALSRGPVSYSEIPIPQIAVNGTQLRDTLSVGISPDHVSIGGLESAGICPRNLRTKGFCSLATTTLLKQITGQGPRPYSMPLTAASTIWQCSSVVPLGLMSSYSSQSYGYEARVATEVEAVNGGSQSLDESVDNIYVFNPRIRCKIIKVLQPEVMESILKLYNKSESFELQDGLKIPLSLTLNSLQYAHHTQALPAFQSNYHVNIPNTYASLRGIAFRFIKTASLNNANLGGTVQAGYPFSEDLEQNDAVVLTKFAIKIGGECILQSSLEPSTFQLPSGGLGIDETFFNYEEADQFMRSQREKCGHIFSAKHHDADKTEREGLETLIGTYQNHTGGNNPCGIVRPYCFSLENLIPRENENMAVGIDMRSIGNVQLEFSLGVFAGVKTDEFGELKPPADDYTMLAILAGDVVYEVSRTGVKDVTSQML